MKTSSANTSSPSGTRTSECAVVALDLDGTLISGNSLHLYLRCGLNSAIRQRRWRDLRGILGALLLRRLRRISHVEMKRRSLRHIPSDAAIYYDFRSRALGKLRPEVMRIVSNFREEGAVILLASAAPDIYIPWIWNGDFLASNAGGQECRGEEKRRRVEEYIASRGGRLEAVVTDHADDLPLMRLAAERQAEVIIVDPSRDTLSQIREAEIPVSRVVRPVKRAECTKPENLTRR